MQTDRSQILIFLHCSEGSSLESDGDERLGSRQESIFRRQDGKAMRGKLLDHGIASKSSQDLGLIYIYFFSVFD